MKGGRLRIFNESRYPDDEVRALVEFGLSEISLTRSGIVAVVKNSATSRRREHGARDYSGTHWSYRIQGIPSGMYDAYFPRDNRSYKHLIVMRLGPPECFPIKPFTRNGFLHDYQTWQEALVGITAHEGKHAEHAHEGAYQRKSGYRRASVAWDGIESRATRVRVGTERIEPKCAAWEDFMLRKFRAQQNGQGIEREPRASGRLPSLGRT